MDLPSKYQGSKFVQGLVNKYEASKAARKRDKAAQVSTPRQVGATLTGAFGGGALARATGSAIVPGLLALAGWVGGYIVGSPDLVNAGTGNAALVAGTAGAMAVDSAMAEDDT